jgi:hypothetical protein
VHRSRGEVGFGTRGTEKQDEPEEDAGDQFPMLDVGDAIAIAPSNTRVRWSGMVGPLMSYQPSAGSAG